MDWQSIGSAPRWIVQFIPSVVSVTLVPLITANLPSPKAMSHPKKALSRCWSTFVLTTEVVQLVNGETETYGGH